MDKPKRKHEAVSYWQYLRGEILFTRKFVIETDKTPEACEAAVLQMIESQKSWAIATETRVETHKYSTRGTDGRIYFEVKDMVYGKYGPSPRAIVEGDIIPTADGHARVEGVGRLPTFEHVWIIPVAYVFMTLYAGSNEEFRGAIFFVLLLAAVIIFFSVQNSLSKRNDLIEKTVHTVRYAKGSDEKAKT